MTEALQKIVAAIEAEMARQAREEVSAPFVGDGFLPGLIKLDGDFDLEKIAQAALEALGAGAMAITPSARIATTAMKSAMQSEVQRASLGERMGWAPGGESARSADPEQVRRMCRKPAVRRCGVLRLYGFGGGTVSNLKWECPMGWPLLRCALAKTHLGRFVQSPVYRFPSIAKVKAPSRPEVPGRTP